MKAAAIYARISNDSSGKAAGVRRQIAECETYAASHGHTVAEIYEDNDISAYRAKVRPAYRRMCEDVKTGARDGVITFHLDRLHRHMIELEQFIILIDSSGADVRTVSGGDYDLSTSDGRAMARVVAVFARKESEDKSRRIKSQRREQANNGIRKSHGRAYGYNRAHTRKIPKEAAVIREAAERILAGDSLRSICRDLEERGVPTTSGKAAWNMNTMRRILMSGRVSAQVEYLGEIVAKGSWPAILTPAETTRLRTIMGDPARRTNNRSPRRYYLTRTLDCGVCGAKMVGAPRRDGERTYRCLKRPGFLGCGRICISADHLEAFVYDAVLTRLDTEGLYGQLATALGDEAPIEELQKGIDEDNAMLTCTADLRGRGEITVSEWLAARAPIAIRIAEAASQLSCLTHSTALDGFVGNSAHLREKWVNFSPARRRSIVDALTHRITIRSVGKIGRVFDVRRIEISWRE